MTDKQIIIDGIEINPNDWLLPYKDIPACEIKDCNEIVYCGDGILGCRIAEAGLVCDDFNNPEEACMYRQLEYYKEILKRKEQECERLRFPMKDSNYAILTKEEFENFDQLKTENDKLKVQNIKYMNGNIGYQLKNSLYKQTLTEIKEIMKKHCRKCKKHKFYHFQLCCTCKYTDILQKISECEGNDETN